MCGWDAAAALTALPLATAARPSSNSTRHHDHPAEGSITVASPWAFEVPQSTHGALMCVGPLGADFTPKYLAAVLFPPIIACSLSPTPNAPQGWRQPQAGGRPFPRSAALNLAPFPRWTSQPLRGAHLSPPSVALEARAYSAGTGTAATNRGVRLEGIWAAVQSRPLDDSDDRDDDNGRSSPPPATPHPTGVSAAMRAHPPVLQSESLR